MITGVMQKYHLSKRMEAVARLVPAGVTACDIGCDHGFAAIYLAEKGICPKVIATDINRGPLSRAREHIENAGLSAYIETRLSDGLEKIEQGEAECVIAAGMGGRLTVRILEDYPEKLRSLRYLVLQPQSELFFVRQSLRRLGFEIRAEDMVSEGGKFYPMMLAEAAGGCTEKEVRDEERTESSCAEKERRRGDRKENLCAEQETEDRDQAAEQSRYEESLADEFGPCLLKMGHPVLAEYLNWWEKQQKEILNQVLTYPERRAQVEEELARIRDARSLMGAQERKLTEVNASPQTMDNI